MQNNRGSWRIQTNREINNVIHGADVERFVKSRRTTWLGHTKRMERHRIARKNLDWRTVGRRSRERPRKRRKEDVEEGLRLSLIHI